MPKSAADLGKIGIMQYVWTSSSQSGGLCSGTSSEKADPITKQKHTKPLSNRKVILRILI